MAKKETTALATLDGYAMLEVAPHELKEIVEANVGPAGFSVSDLDRIVMPSGGQPFWSVPDLSGEPSAEKAIEGVIIEWQDRRAYWARSLDESGGGSPPDCSSDDGITGVGDPGGACEACPLSKFGSGPDGVGQACKQMRMLYMLREDQILPVVITAPPTSLAPVRQYMLRLTSRRVPYYGVLTSLELEQTTNQGGIKYSKIKPVLVDRLDASVAEKVKSMRDSLRPYLTAIRTQDLVNAQQHAGEPEDELEEIAE